MTERKTIRPSDLALDQKSLTSTTLTTIARPNEKPNAPEIAQDSVDSPKSGTKSR